MKCVANGSIVNGSLMLKLDGIPSGWSVELLDDITKRGSGHTPSKSHSKYWNGGVKWVSLADSDKLDRRYIGETDKEISSLGLENSSAVIHPKGTVVLSRDAGVGKSAILAEDMAVSQHFIAWNCAEQRILDNQFLYYWLQFKKPLFERIANGSTIKTIGLPFFRKLTINFPTLLGEQRKIAEILNTWDDAIDLAKSLVAHQRRQRAGILSNLYGSFDANRQERIQRYKIGELLTEVNRYVEWDDDTNYQLVSIRRRFGGMFKRAVVPGSAIKTKVLKTVLVGDFVVARMQAVHGAVAMTSNEFDGYCVSDSYLTFQASDPTKLYLPFFGYLAQTRAIQKAIIHSSFGVTIEKMTFDLNAFLKQEVMVPSDIQRQRGIAEIMLNVDRKIQLLESRLATLIVQKQALMQRLLTGEVRVPL